MALVVGLDTYISETDATQYVESAYVSTDAKRTSWAALSDADKEVRLRQACFAIEGLGVWGIKATPNQHLQFPRAGYTTDTRSGQMVLYVQTEVPNNVKYAQVEIALQLTVGIDSRVDLQRQGVKSFSLGALSESYAGSSGVAKVLCAEAYELMSEYMVGGFDIT